MRLYVKRDTSELYSRYEVLDDKGNLKYTVRGKQNPSGEHIRLCDKSGAVVCKIRCLGVSAFSAYVVKVGSETVRMNIAVSGAVASVRFHGISFCIRGDVITGSYDILDADNSVVCAVYKDFVKNALTLSVELNERELFCIAAAICIDSLSVKPTPALQMT